MWLIALGGIGILSFVGYLAIQGLITLLALLALPFLMVKNSCSYSERESTTSKIIREAKGRPVKDLMNKARPIRRVVGFDYHEYRYLLDDGSTISKGAAWFVDSSPVYRGEYLNWLCEQGPRA